MLKIKPFRQRAGSCGPASLKMILNYFGVDVSERQLIKLTGCTPGKGVGAKGILEGAKKLGFDGFIKDDSNFNELRHYVIKNKIPVIVDWFWYDEGHYSVVVDIDRENIYMLDPSLGHLRALRLRKFRRLWFDFPQDYIKKKEDIILRRIIVIYPSSSKLS